MNKGIFRFNEDLWVEKYRPQTLDSYLGEEGVREKFKNYTKNGLDANILLSGEPGIGKSTFAHILVKELGWDYKYINASDDNNIETVRVTITNYCTTSSFSDKRILILDEFGYFTPQAQGALKSIMEQFTSKVRFILTCNEIENVVDAIKSRCQHFPLLAPDKSKVKNRMVDILNKEGVDFEDDELDTIINYNYPDLRQILNDIQKQVVGKTLKLDKEYFRLITYEKKTIDVLSKINSSNLYDKVLELRQLLADCRLKKYNRLYRCLYERLDEYCKAPKHKVGVPLTLAKYVYQDKDTPDKEINIMACLTDISELITS